MPASPILIEGLTPDEIIDLEELEDLAVIGEPIIVRVGSAEVLAQFSIEDKTLNAELCVVDKGGEGVLKTLIAVIEKAAARRGVTAIEWWVYARNCAVPNPKLMRVLELLGFEVRDLAGGSQCYWQRKSINDSVLLRRR
ncbi:MAG: hypothetical protein OER56_01160 [Hyphomicrobiales bacterium]|nr:hypothetical protein [Hyphomicrobiales bacterium]